MTFKSKIAFLAFALVLIFAGFSQAKGFRLLNEPVDISSDFRDFTNTYYFT